MIPNSDITIYNKSIDPESRGEVWQSMGLYNVVWQATQGVTSFRNMTAANTALILIPFALGKNYLDPKAWRALSDKSKYWTLQEGDVIVRTIVTEEISEDYTMTQLRKDYSNVVTISAIRAMDEGSENMRHWELDCK